MKIICAAIVDSAQQRDNLCQCVSLLGGVPDISGNTVCVEYDGSITTAAKFVELFEQYVWHEIRTLP